MIKFTWRLLRRFHHLENFLKFLKNVSILNWFEFDFFYCWFDVRKIVSVLNVNFVIFMIFAIFRIFKNPKRKIFIRHQNPKPSGLCQIIHWMVDSLSMTGRMEKFFIMLWPISYGTRSENFAFELVSTTVVIPYKLYAIWFVFVTLSGKPQNIFNFIQFIS